MTAQPANPQVSFYVKKSGPNQSTRGTIVFETVVTNIGGFWNRVGSTYVIPTRGIYVIHLGIKARDGQHVEADIMKDTDVIQRVITDSGQSPTGFMTSVREMSVNEQVWGRLNRGYLDGGSNGLTYMSGFMLFAME